MRLGLTQSELAKAGGVNRITIYQYEKGDRRPSLNFLIGAMEVGVSLVFTLFGAHQLIVAQDKFVDLELATDIYALVDKAAIDKKGRPLPLVKRKKIYKELLSLAVNMKKDEVDKSQIKAALMELVA